MTIKKIWNWIIVGILIFLLGFVLFYKLGYAPLNVVDEARHGINAYEMIKNGNYLITTCMYEVDYFNLKPPLSEYFILIGYMIFGYNAVGMRFYSAAAMFVCAILCAWFLNKRFGKIAMMSSLLFFSATKPLLEFHCARSGDADSIFILFYGIALICLALPMESFAGVYIACLAFSFAFLAKSFHAGCIGVVVLLYLIISKKLFAYKPKNWFLTILCTIGPIGVWAAARAAYDGADFLSQMWLLDVATRSNTVLTGGGGDFTFYLRFLKNDLNLWLLVLIVVVSLAISRKNTKRDKNFELIMLLGIFCPVLLFSLVKTKLTWYVLCIYPAVILFTAYELELAFDKLATGLRREKNGGAMCLMGLLCICVVGSIACSLGNVRWVAGLENNDELHSAAVNMLTRDEKFAGKKIYMLKPDEPDYDWDKTQVLEFEWYGDSIPQDGSYEAWKEDKDAYLVVWKTRVETIELDEPYDLIAEYGEYQIIGHK